MLSYLRAARKVSNDSTAKLIPPTCESPIVLHSVSRQLAAVSSGNLTLCKSHRLSLDVSASAGCVCVMSHRISPVVRVCLDVSVLSLRVYQCLSVRLSPCLSSHAPVRLCCPNNTPSRSNYHPHTLPFIPVPIFGFSCQIAKSPLRFHVLGSNPETGFPRVFLSSSHSS